MFYYIRFVLLDDFRDNAFMGVMCVRTQEIVSQFISSNSVFIANSMIVLAPRRIRSDLINKPVTN